LANDKPVYGRGSRLNIAEIKLSAMVSQCLNRRIGAQEKLSEDLGVWQLDRNANREAVKRPFAAGDARIKLRSLYPVF
jgi:hypothetical protein